MKHACNYIGARKNVALRQNRSGDVDLCTVLGLDRFHGLSFKRAGLPTRACHAGIEMTVRAMKAGAVEFLTKPYRDQALLEAVPLAIENDRARRESDVVLSGIQQQLISLTPRERQVMALTAAGQSSKQIAGTIGISDVTARVHRRQVMRKMRAKSLAELIRIAETLTSHGLTV